MSMDRTSQATRTWEAGMRTLDPQEWRCKRQILRFKVLPYGLPLSIRARPLLPSLQDVGTYLSKQSKGRARAASSLPETWQRSTVRKPSSSFQPSSFGSFRTSDFRPRTSSSPPMISNSSQVTAVTSSQVTVATSSQVTAATGPQP